MSETMSQAEIEAMLNQAQGSSSPSDGAQATPPGAVEDVDAYLSKDEQDTLGEVGNICMGTAATTMYSLLGHRVEITTPTINVYPNKEAMFKEFDKPFIVVEVEYVEGIDGNNLLLLRKEDAAIITDVLMGGDGHVDEEYELSELHFSAINEVMNQMVGSSATALANILGKAVDISPPTTMLMDEETKNEVKEMLEENAIIRISFDMEIEGLLKSKLMQVMPLSFGTQLVSKLSAQQEAETASAASQAAAPPPPTPAPAPAPAAAPAPAPAQHAPAPPPQQAAPRQQRVVDVQPVNYHSFDEETYDSPHLTGNIALLGDVPLDVTVELGQTQKCIQEVLEFGVGSIIILHKLAGEPVDILVNGKLIARGEVVVIDENYGVRITDIISPSQRL